MSTSAHSPPLRDLPVMFVATATRTLQTAMALAPKSIIATDLLRPMLGPHAHSQRCSRAVLAVLFPSVDFSELTLECDVQLGEQEVESRASADARVSAGLRQVCFVGF